ncbi:MAG TPA: hypothetical protein VGO58_11470 [Chitinophagaceae bacterium]|jgi:hypothetical protein|nr:hypothetical protein [Chitinophagaceae bacterium]
MHLSANLKKLAVAGLAFFIIACNNSSKKEKKEKNTADTAVVETPDPPLVPPPGVKLENAIKKCFTNDGLQYAVVITFRFSSDADVTGKIESRELETNKTTTGQFTGTFNRNQFTAQFTDTPPVIGNSSEWTSKPWTINEKKISIPFRSKESGTGKWEETNYDFDLTGCK